MGDCTSDFPVLKDWCPGHSLYDSACNLKKFRICHLDLQTFIFFFCMFVGFCYTNFVFFYFSFYTASYNRIPFFDLIRCHNADRLCIPEQVVCTFKGSEYPTICIFINSSQNIIPVINDDSFYPARFPSCSFLDTANAGLVDPSVFNLHQSVRICVMDSMPQCSKTTVRVQKCHSSKPLCIVPYPYSQHVLILFIPHRFYLHIQISGISPEL